MTNIKVYVKTEEMFIVDLPIADYNKSPVDIFKEYILTDKAIPTNEKSITIDIGTM